MRIIAAFALCFANLCLSQPLKTIAPDYLKAGDTVGIVATARKIDAVTLNPAIDLLKSWGLHVVLGKTIGKSQNQLAGPDWQRATDLQEMLDNPTIKAIWSAKGGYGTVRIIDRIDFSKFKKKPKWIVGFSDVTVLHSHVNTLGIQSLHAMMAISAKSASAEAKESLRSALFGKPQDYKLPANDLNRIGRASGEIVGGNLSVLYSLLGSKSEIDLKGKILFIEDLDEYLYHIDRMLMNFKRNGYFSQISGLIIGGMTSMNDNEIPWGMTANQIVEDLVKEYKFPVLYNFPAGHIKDNRAIVLGSKAVLEINSSGSTLNFD